MSISDVMVVLHRVTTSGIYDTVGIHRTSASGEFVFADISTDSYIISAYLPDQLHIRSYFGNTSEWTQAEEIIVDSDRIGLNIQLMEDLCACFPVDLGVSFELSGQFIVQLPVVEDVVINIQRQTFDGEWVPVGSTISKQGDGFLFVNVPEGVYRFSVQLPGIQTEMEPFTVIYIDRQEKIFTAVYDGNSIVVTEDELLGHVMNKLPVIVNQHGQIEFAQKFELIMVHSLSGKRIGEYSNQSSILTTEWGSGIYVFSVVQNGNIHNFKLFID